MYVRIIQTPSGEAPESVRRAWVGMVLPVHPRRPVTTRAIGVLSGPRSWWRQWVWVLLRRGALHTGYRVGAAEALRRLARHAPEAERWWRQNTPYLYRDSSVLSFDEPACEVISSAADPTWFIQLNAAPCPGNTEFPDVDAALINCWVRAPSLEAAREIARADIKAWDWSIGEPQEAFPVEASTYTGTTDLFEAAQTQGVAYEFDCNAHNRGRHPPSHPQPLS